MGQAKRDIVDSDKKRERETGLAEEGKKLAYLTYSLTHNPCMSSILIEVTTADRARYSLPFP